jgi:hypothetical protein
MLASRRLPPINADWFLWQGSGQPFWTVYPDYHPASCFQIIERGALSEMTTAEVGKPLNRTINASDNRCSTHIFGNT